MSPDYLRLLNDTSFYSQQTFSFSQRLHAIPLLCTPTDALCCSARRTTAPTRTAKTISWFARGLRHCQTLWKFLETSVMLPCSRQDRHGHWSILVKSDKKENSIVTWTKNFCWARGPFRSQQLQWDPPSLVRSGTEPCQRLFPVFLLRPKFSQLIHILQWWPCLSLYHGFDSRETAVLENQTKSTYGSYWGPNHTHRGKFMKLLY